MNKKQIIINHGIKYTLCILIVFLFFTCHSPSKPINEIKRIEILNSNSIDTQGNCLDLDIDIQDSILVAATNYNGYMIYKIEYEENGLFNILNHIEHIEPNDMDPSLGDNRAQSVILSKNHNIAFVMDQYDHIWLYKYGEGENINQYDNGIANYLEEDLCYGGTWLSIAIDDKDNQIGIFTLMKHNAAEIMPYCFDPNSIINNCGAVQAGDRNCNDLREDGCILEDYPTEFECENNNYSWNFPGCQVGDYNEYSTSLVYTNLEDVGPFDLSMNGEPSCEYISNQGSIAEKIYFADGLLAQTYGELGVRIYKQADYTGCSIDEVFTDDNGDDVWNENEDFVDDNDNNIYDEGVFTDIAGEPLCEYHELNSVDNVYQSCCEAQVCPKIFVDMFGEDACNDISSPIGQEFIELNGYTGFGGIFSSVNGIIPKIYAEFDTPGEVESIYLTDKIIFSGLSHSNGCLIVKLGDDGSILAENYIALGYSIKGIDQDRGLLALAAGHDGILLFEWIGGINPEYIGMWETPYANNVKVSDNTIFVATEDGIEIIQIEIEE